MTDHVSVWRLSRDLGSYPALIAGLCSFYQIEIVAGPRGRLVRAADVEVIRNLLWCWRSRPKLSYITGKPRRKKPTEKRIVVKRRHGPRPRCSV